MKTHDVWFHRNAQTEEFRFLRTYLLITISGQTDCSRNTKRRRTWIQLEKIAVIIFKKLIIQMKWSSAYVLHYLCGCAAVQLSVNSLKWYRWIISGFAFYK
jgi:hypothetical protein